MQTTAIDHVNLYIPETGVEDALRFYRDRLGFETENVEAYRRGDRSLFTFRPRGGGCVIHVIPDDGFEAPGHNYNHLAIDLDAPTEEVETLIDTAGWTVERRRDRGNRPGADVAIYVRDPFGYTVELRPSG
ncbi:MAG: VOC family protein [Halobacteriales archaeon]